MSEAKDNWKIVVDWKACVGHGQCEFAAPNVFTINDEGKLELNETPDDKERKAVEQAIRRCPTRALSLAER
jgi:ferredoxin